VLDTIERLLEDKSRSNRGEGRDNVMTRIELTAQLPERPGYTLQTVLPEPSARAALGLSTGGIA